MERGVVEGDMGRGTNAHHSRPPLSRVRPSSTRQRDLDRLARWVDWPVPTSSHDTCSRLRCAAYLRMCCKRMRQLGLANSHAYDFAIHSALHDALDIERRELALLKNNSQEIAA